MELPGKKISELEKRFSETNDPRDLRLIIMECLNLGDLNRARMHNAKLGELAPYDPGQSFFAGLIFEKSGDLNKAFWHYKFAFYRMPSQRQAFERAWHLVKTLDQEQLYQKPADVVFYTGNYLLEPKFNPETLKTRGLGGSESAFVYLTAELAKLGLKVLAFCNCDKPGIYDGVEFLPVEDFAFYHQVNQYKKVVGLRNADAFLGDLNPKARHIFWLQDAATTQLYKDFDFKYYRIDEVCVLSQAHKKNWQERHFLGDDKFFLTKNGFDPGVFYPETGRKSQLIYASRPERGFKEAVAVYQHLRHKFPELKLKACTYSSKDNILDDPLIREVSDLFDMEGVEFLGALSKIEFARHLRESLVLLHPNVQNNVETSCIAAIEAQACGVPVVCGRGGAMAETVLDGRTGLVVEWNNNPETLVRELGLATDKILSDQDFYSKLSCGARQWAHENYRWDLIAGEWMKHWLA